LIKNIREARMLARMKIALAIIVTLGATTATLAHEGKSIVDQYGDDANYEHFPDYPAAPRYRCHAEGSGHPMPGEAGEH
jgi:hypothetical protein